MGSGSQGDVQIKQCIDFVVIDFWEDDLFFHAHVVVVVIIEGFGIQVVEVTHVWQGDGQQMIQEFVHMLAMQSDLDVNWSIFTNFEICDRFVGMSYNDFLIGDLFEVGNGVLDDFFVIDCFVQVHVQGDYRDWETKQNKKITKDRKSTRLNSSHEIPSRMPSSA